MKPGEVAVADFDEMRNALVRAIMHEDLDEVYMRCTLSNDLDSATRFCLFCLPSETPR